MTGDWEGILGEVANIGRCQFSLSSIPIPSPAL